MPPKTKRKRSRHDATSSEEEDEEEGSAANNKKSATKVSEYTPWVLMFPRCSQGIPIQFTRHPLALYYSNLNHPMRDVIAKKARSADRKLTKKPSAGSDSGQDSQDQALDDAFG